MAEHVKITADCVNAPDEKTFLLPTTRSLPAGRYLLVSGGGRESILRPGLRTDEGDAACVNGMVLAGFGGNGADVTYEMIGFQGRLRRDGMLTLQLAIAVLTVIGAGLTAWGTLLKSGAATASTWEQTTGSVVFLVAAALAVLKFVQELKKL